MNRLAIVALALVTLGIVINAQNLTPSSVKLAFTGENSEIRVTWFTFKESKQPYVQYSTEYIQDPNTSSEEDVTFVKAESHAFLTIGWHGIPHNSILSGLADGTTYYYAVGDKEASQWSQVYNFTTRVLSNNDQVSGPFAFAVYGDMGSVKNNVTVANLIPRVDSLDFIMHVGDIAYADLTDKSFIGGNETVWNIFLQSVECLTSQIPYMTCPGNHDIMVDLAIYRKTFNMPTENEFDTYYSFDYRGVHFVGISSESDYFPLSPQHIWLENDLKTYRESNPNGWVIAYAHRPIYCSTQWGWCYKSLIREKFQEYIEDIFYKYNVDLFLAGHAHDYERSLPVYQNQVMNDYSDPKATIHMVIGTGGNEEGEDHDWLSAPSWSTGIRSSDTGFGQVTIINATTILFEFIDNQSNTVLDSQYINKGTFN
ncbi:metallophosphoesterase domain-containing protein [Tieghemostelium lacteum]|uniref:Purple acid phosphatase n=1 Tax=Tieghemostelium lacteum TaxID=361077 RepID=A0A152A1C3_TIELA|nr:metallophosphoesterase domain-containing protein [Tieghemostelium lacteum]|eukprot:KYQ99998.1 metallophosphoesterase domain-containing protein [Tieghemostelium lacteum]